LPIVEAALARLPVVVSDIPIFREVGGDEATYISLSADVDRIAVTVIDRLQSAGVRLRRRVLREYRWDSIVDRLIVPILQSPPGDT
jgi:glycosyltransferase involved in cell wall biosynthesis